MLTALVLAWAFEAGAYEINDFDCCHVEDATVGETVHVLLVPVADRRAVVQAEPDRFASVVGIVRGGYGNPFNLQSPRSVASLVTEALRDQLVAMGHQVVVADDGPAPGQPPLEAGALAALAKGRQGIDLVLHGTIHDWEVDVGSYGTYKSMASVSLVAVDPRGGSVRGVATLDPGGIQQHSTSSLKPLAHGWYGRKGFPYRNTAAVERGLIELVREMKASDLFSK